MENRIKSFEQFVNEFEIENNIVNNATIEDKIDYLLLGIKNKVNSDTRKFGGYTLSEIFKQVNNEPWVDIEDFEVNFSLVSNHDIDDLDFTSQEEMDEGLEEATSEIIVIIINVASLLGFILLSHDNEHVELELDEYNINISLVD